MDAVLPPSQMVFFIMIMIVMSMIIIMIRTVVMLAIEILRYSHCDDDNDIDGNFQVFHIRGLCGFLWRWTTPREG